MYRFVDMAIRNQTQEGNMDKLFGSPEWRRLADIQDSEERLSKTVRFFGNQLKAKHVIHMTMRGVNNAVKYVLLHATNHPKGREKMKEAIWSVVPDGSFTAYERDNPEQLVFLGPDPDLRPLEDIIWGKFRGRKVILGEKETKEIALATLYLPKHVHKILRDYKNKKIVTVTGYGDRFGFNRNPLFSFPDKRP
jgi:hypothetical protein